MKDAFGVSKGLPSALRGGKGEKMVMRALKPYRKSAEKAAKKIKPPKDAYKRGKAGIKIVEGAAGTPNAYMLSRLYRNEMGGAVARRIAQKRKISPREFKGMNARIGEAKGARGWEKKRGF